MTFHFLLKYAIEEKNKWFELFQGLHFFATTVNRLNLVLLLRLCQLILGH